MGFQGLRFSGGLGFCLAQARKGVFTPDLTRLFAAFSLPERISGTGAMIARTAYTRFSPQAGQEGESFQNRVLRQTPGALVLSCRGFWGENCLEELTAMLILHPKPLKAPPTSPDAALPWRAFSKEEVSAFSRRTGDPNPIHQGEKPVVQGLLILEALLTRRSAARLTIRFFSPLYSGETVFLEQSAAKKGEGLLWRGSAGGRLLFEAEES